MRSTEASSLFFFVVVIVSIAEFLAWILYFSVPHRKKKRCTPVISYRLFLCFFFFLLFLLSFLLFFCRCVLPYQHTSLFLNANTRAFFPSPVFFSLFKFKLAEKRRNNPTIENALINARKDALYTKPTSSHKRHPRKEKEKKKRKGYTKCVCMCPLVLKPSAEQAVDNPHTHAHTPACQPKTCKRKNNALCTYTMELKSVVAPFSGSSAAAKLPSSSCTLSTPAIRSELVSSISLHCV